MSELTILFALGCVLVVSFAFSIITLMKKKRYQEKVSRCIFLIGEMKRHLEPFLLLTYPIASEG